MTFASLIRIAKERKQLELAAFNLESNENKFDVQLEKQCSDISSPIFDSYQCSIEGISLCSEYITVSLASLIFEYCVLLESRGEFVKLRGRRCLSLGGTVTSAGLVPKDNMPVWLKSLISSLKILPRIPNHALINIYDAGEGILPHEDGPAYYPYAAILSVGCGSVFDFLGKLNRCISEQIYLSVGSLLLFQGEAYSNVLHQYADRRIDQVKGMVERLGSSVLKGNQLIRGKRISITLRYVPPIEHTLLR